jgi:hypothetical protein
MRNCKVATQDLAPTSDQLGGHVPGLPVPDGALISDDGDDSFMSDTESEGDFCGDNADDTGPEVHIPNEGAQGHNIDTDGEGRCRSQQRHDPIDRLVKNPPPAPDSLFLGVVSRSASGRDLTRVPKPNLNIWETDELVSNPPFSKNNLAGVISQHTFWREQ